MLPPRYWSAPGMASAKLLYNSDRALQYQTVVFVKEPADVWTFGPMASCPASHRVTEDQKSRLIALFRKAAFVVLLTEKEFARPGVRQLFCSFQLIWPGRFAQVRLPRGDNSGLFTRAFLRDYVAKEAGKQGVRVCYEKWE
jgi:hypothetical protein